MIISCIKEDEVVGRYEWWVAMQIHYIIFLSKQKPNPYRNAKV